MGRYSTFWPNILAYFVNVSGVVGQLLCCVLRYVGTRYDKNLITVMDKNNKNGCGCGTTSKCDEKSKATTAKKTETHEKPKK